jgi:hypothetical protein
MRLCRLRMCRFGSVDHITAAMPSTKRFATMDKIAGATAVIFPLVETRGNGKNGGNAQSHTVHFVRISVYSNMRKSFG